MTEANIIILPADLSAVAAPALLETVLAHRGAELTIDGADVRRLGAQCLQVLMAAGAAWAADGFELSFENFSPELVNTLELLGVTTAHLAYRKDRVA